MLEVVLVDQDQVWERQVVAEVVLEMEEIIQVIMVVMLLLIQGVVAVDQLEMEALVLLL